MPRNREIDNLKLQRRREKIEKGRKTNFFKFIFRCAETPLSHLLILHPASLDILFTFSPALPTAPSFDASLSAQLRAPGALPSPGAPPACLVCQERPVALQRIGDLLYAVVAHANDDELCGECLWGGGVDLRALLGARMYFLSTHALAPPAPAADLLGSAYRVVTAVCEEEPPTAARLAEFYGKVVVCLHEAFSGQGFQLQRSLDAVLRNAKLKAPA